MFHAILKYPFQPGILFGLVAESLSNNKLKIWNFQRRIETSNCCMCLGQSQFLLSSLSIPERVKRGEDVSVLCQVVAFSLQWHQLLQFYHRFCYSCFSKLWFLISCNYVIISAFFKAEGKLTTFVIVQSSLKTTKVLKGRRANRGNPKLCFFEITRFVRQTCDFVAQDRTAKCLVLAMLCLFSVLGFLHGFIHIMKNAVFYVIF